MSLLSFYLGGTNKDPHTHTVIAGGQNTETASYIRTRAEQFDYNVAGKLYAHMNQ